MFFKPQVRPQIRAYALWLGCVQDENGFSHLNLWEFVSYLWGFIQWKRRPASYKWKIVFRQLRYCKLFPMSPKEMNALVKKRVLR